MIPVLLSGCGFDRAGLAPHEVGAAPDAVNTVDLRMDQVPDDGGVEAPPDAAPDLPAPYAAADLPVADAAPDGAVSGRVFWPVADCGVSKHWMRHRSSGLRFPCLMKKPRP